MIPAPVPHAELSCPLCGAPNDVASHRCGQCGGSLREARIAQGLAPPPAIVPFSCEECGASLLTERSQRPVRCPLCDADHMKEQATDPNALVPELVIPFVVDRERASDVLHEWIGLGVLRPRRVVKQAARDGVTPLYAPCWMFSALAHSSWRAEIAESWTRTVTDTVAPEPAQLVEPEDAALDAPPEPSPPSTAVRPPPAPVDVQEVEWFPLEGRHHHFYAQEIVGATDALTVDELRATLPFDTRVARPYRAGYLSERATLHAAVGSDAALPAARERFVQVEAENVYAFLPGDASRNLQIATSLHRVQGTLVLVPLYVASWRHAGRSWRFVMNGQTGRHTGKAPLSAMRVGALAAALVAALVLAFAFGGGGA